MEEIFEQQKAYLHQEESKIKDLEKKVRFYADTKAPLINDLEKLHKPKIGLGEQEKALEPFHIGTHPDRKRLEKLLFWNGVWFVSVIAVVSLFLCQFEHVWGIVPPLFVPLTLGAALIFVLFGSGIPQLGLGNIADRYFQYVEFSREGIAYISPKTLQEKIRFLQKTFHRQDTLTYVSYDQVEKVSVIHDTKYIRIFLPIASELFVTSFVFHLKDKTSFSILHQMFYGNDEEVILRILREHVGQVVITKRPCALCSREKFFLQHHPYHGHNTADTDENGYGINGAGQSDIPFQVSRKSRGRRRDGGKYQNSQSLAVL